MMNLKKWINCHLIHVKKFVAFKKRFIKIRFKMAHTFKKFISIFQFVFAEFICYINTVCKSLFDVRCVVVGGAAHNDRMCHSNSTVCGVVLRELRYDYASDITIINVDVFCRIPNSGKLCTGNKQRPFSIA